MTTTVLLERRVESEDENSVNCVLVLSVNGAKYYQSAILSKELLEDLDFIKALDNDLETLLEKIYIKIAYLKKDFNSEHINLYIRVRNIYSYHQLLIRILQKK